jgi:hypothetical protein
MVTMNHFSGPHQQRLGGARLSLLQLHIGICAKPAGPRDMSCILHYHTTTAFSIEPQATVGIIYNERFAIRPAYIQVRQTAINH